MAAIHKCFHQKNIVGHGGFDDCLREILVYGDRFLHQHMLARLGGLNGPLGMLGVWCRDIDCLHGGVAQKRFVAAKAVLGGNAKFPPKCIGLVLGSTGDGDEFSGPAFLDCARKCAGNRTGTDDSPMQFAGHKISHKISIARVRPGGNPNAKDREFDAERHPARHAALWVDSDTI